MKHALTLGLCLSALTAQASFLDLSSAELDIITGVTTASSAFSNALTVQSKTAGNVLVIGTFSSSADDAKTGAGAWQLSDGTNQSTPIERTFNGRKDAGIGSVVHIFTGVSQDANIHLQHRAQDQTLKTMGGNLVAIPLTTSEGDQLNYGVHQQSADSTTTSTSFDATTVTTSVEVNRASNNGIYMAASFNSQATGVVAGEWQLQYKKSTDGSWTATGSTVSRSMSDTSDTGSVTLYALEEGLDAGTYEVRLVAKSSDAGVGVITLNSTLAAVSLSYTNATGGGYFDGFSDTATSLNRLGDALETSDAQATLNLDLTHAEAGVFASMNFSAQTVGAANNTAGFDLFMNGLTPTNNQANTRYFEKDLDKASGGSVGFFTNIKTGENTIYGRLADGNDKVQAPSANLVGFVTESIPEPAVATLIIGFGGVLLAGRRFFKK